MTMPQCPIRKPVSLERNHQSSDDGHRSNLIFRKEKDQTLVDVRNDKKTKFADTTFRRRQMEDSATISLIVYCVV